MCKEIQLKIINQLNVNENTEKNKKVKLLRAFTKVPKIIVF